MARKSTSANAKRSTTEAFGDKAPQEPRPRSPKLSGMPAAMPTTSASDPVPAVIARAHDMGLLKTGTQHVGARLPTKLLEQAKKRTGIKSTTDLLAFALANVAVDDDFAAAFVAARGKLDPDLDVGF